MRQFHPLLLLLLVAIADARSPYKRNTYGDEAVTPAAEPEAPAETAAPETAPETVPSENAPVEQTQSEKSGYRKRRDAQNSYGDEPVTEAPKQEYPQDAAPAPEAAAEQVPAETAAPEATVEHSGYRKKRDNQNNYGDEPVAQTESAAPAETPAPEMAAESVPAGAGAQAASEKSGYRKRRDAQNSYGDEPVTEASKQENPQDAETAAPEVAQEAVATENHVPDAPVEQSGY